MRTLVRLISLLCLAAAVIAGIVDSIQSVASDSVVLTPFGAALFSVNPGILAAAESYFRDHLSAYAWDTVVEWILLQPAFMVFLTLSLLFWLIAYKREPAGRLAIR